MNLKQLMIWEMLIIYIIIHIKKYYYQVKIVYENKYKNIYIYIKIKKLLI